MNGFKLFIRRGAHLCLVASILVSTVSPSLAGQKVSADKSSAAAVANGKFELTIDNIMRGPALVGYEPRALRWSADSQRIYFQWKRHDEPREKEFATYVANRDGSGLKKLTEEEARHAPPTGGDLSRDKTLTVFTAEGDVFLYDHASGRRRHLTDTSDAETNARLTRDQRRVYFTRSGNLYVMSLDTGALVQVTDIRAGGAQAGTGSGGQFGGGQSGRAAAAERRGTDSQEYLKKEERDLLDIVKRRAEQREQQEERRKRENPRKPFNLGPRQSATSLHLSPDEKHVLATVVDAAEGAKSTIVPNYVTESAYTEDIPARTKVGDAQSRSRLAMISVDTGDVKWVDHGQKEVAPQTQARTERTTTERQSGEAEQSRQGAGERERAVQLFQPVWSEDGSKAVMLARSADNKDRWVLALDTATGKTRVIAREHDDAWVGGPGAFTLGWMKDNQHVYFQSERSGYSHLYTVSFDGGEAKPLTSGNWEVTGVDLSGDKTRFFLTTSEVHPGERHLYVMSAEGGERVKITSLPGNHQASVSPDEKALALIYSYSNKPPEVYVSEARAGAEMKQVTRSPAPEFWNYAWIEPPIVTFNARDGATVHARLYRPKNVRPNGAAVIFVHGAGYLQNVHRWWSSYYREYMFHHLLMERGFTVLDIDYRASAGYGRDWRTGIYRHMGGKDLSDQVDGARWLASAHGVDPKRIGIYGGSYGGFITLMALFTEPDVFAAGASLRPVTDWAHYNHPYTSNILNTPQADAEAYKKSSPIYFAEGLRGALLICHGMVDVNVHFQDTVRLVQRLIELRKENWELAVYPVEDHGFVEPASWADEYKRILKLFTERLLHPDSRSLPSGRKK